MLAPAYFFGAYIEQASELAQGRPLRRIYDQKFGLRKKSLNRRTNYLIKHSQPLKAGDVSTHMQQVATMLDLETKAAAMQHVARTHAAHERAARDRVRRIQELAENYHKSKVALFREKTRYERHLQARKALRRQAEQVAKENETRQEMKARIEKETQAVKELQKVKRKVDVQTFALGQLWEEYKQTHAQEVGRMISLRRKIDDKCVQLDKADAMRGSLDHLNGALRHYDRSLDALAPLVLRTRQRDKGELCADVKYMLAGSKTVRGKVMLPK